MRIEDCRMEVWRSSHNQEEIHLFVPGDANTYLLGWNPQKISTETVVEILKEMMP